MTIAEILPQIQQLPDAEKRRLVELLTAELQNPSHSDPGLPAEPLPIWSPHDSYQAAFDRLDFARKNGVGRSWHRPSALPTRRWIRDSGTRA